MWSVERDRGRIELHCSECGALLADEEEPPTSLRLVA
jgi:hypothetical protein